MFTSLDYCIRATKCAVLDTHGNGEPMTSAKPMPSAHPLSSSSCGSLAPFGMGNAAHVLTHSLIPGAALLVPEPTAPGSAKWGLSSRVPEQGRSFFAKSTGVISRSQISFENAIAAVLACNSFTRYQESSTPSKPLCPCVTMHRGYCSHWEFSTLAGTLFLDFPCFP